MKMGKEPTLTYTELWRLVKALKARRESASDLVHLTLSGNIYHHKEVRPVRKVSEYAILWRTATGEVFTCKARGILSINGQAVTY